MEEAEKAGVEGNVNLAQSLVEEANKLREERDQCEVLLYLFLIKNTLFFGNGIL